MTYFEQFFTEYVEACYNKSFRTYLTVFLIFWTSAKKLLFSVVGEEIDTDHFDFSLIFSDLPQLRDFRVAYGVRDCGMNFEWNLFQFTARDCLQLSKCIASTKHLTSFAITRSKVLGIALLF